MTPFGALFLLLALSACGNLQWPPPHSTGGGPTLSNPPQSGARGTIRAVPQQRTGGMVLVKQGDTLYSLSLRHKVSIRSLIEANNVRPPYNLTVGQRLVLPPPREHVVRAGDTLYGISRSYGVDVSSLARINQLVPPYRILPGETLRLPDTTTTLVSAPADRPVRGPATRPPAPPQAEPPRPGDKPRRVVRIPTPPAKQGGGFIWPVRGKLISAFGPKRGGLHNDGINIAAPRGAPVKAAENGVVAYAGNELRGFGNLLLVRHAEGWITAYAHADQLLVRRGDKVRKGEVIARVGATGNVASPQLHFEIRKGKQAVNPIRHLAEQSSRVKSRVVSERLAEPAG